MCGKSLLQAKGCLVSIVIFGCVSLWIANEALEENFSKGTVHLLRRWDCKYREN